VNILRKPAFDRAYKKISEQEQAEIAAAISRLHGAIGKPHLHSGLGIRPFGKFLECRAGLKNRVLFSLDSGDVILECVGNHNDIARFIKNR